MWIGFYYIRRTKHLRPSPTASAYPRTDSSSTWTRIPETPPAAIHSLALDFAVKSWSVKKGDVLACAGFGAGLSWGAAIFLVEGELLQ